MEHPDRELEYIISCLACKLFAGRTFPHPSPDMDWKKLYILVQKQRLSGHMFTLGQNVATGWDSSFEHRLRLDYYQYSLYGEYCSGHIRRILEAINKLGIRVIVLKGWAHIQTIYDTDFGQRLCEDIDILIHPDDVDTVEVVLHGHGYIPEAESWPDYNRRYHNGMRYFVPQENTGVADNFSIGLHWGLIHIPSYNPGRIDVNILFDEALPLRIMEVPVLQLTPEDEVVYLCAHLDLHHRSEEAIFRYYELARLISMFGDELNWSKVIEKSIRWHLVLSVDKILRKLNEIWNGLVCEEVLNKFDKVRLGLDEKLVDLWVEKTHGHPFSSHVLRWITFPRVWKRPLIMLQDIFPSLEYMISRYGNAPLGLWPLLYLQRFFRAFRSM